MKKIIAFSTLLLLLLAFDAFGQSSITITPKKTTYTRKGKNVQRGKRTFWVRYPIVSGAIKPAIKKELENTISYWRVFERTLKENLSGEDDGLDSLDYEVNYNKNGILSIRLIDEHSGAYPDTSFANLVIDLKTGKQINFADVFTPDANLVEMVSKKLAVEKRESIKQVDADKDNDAEAKASMKETINNLEFAIDSFSEFRISDKGVTILYDAEFPHVIQALQPAGEYFFTYAQLKPFIKKEGLLGRFVR